MTRVLGIDPGSLRMGFGVVDVQGSRLQHVEHGVIRAGGDDLAKRLLDLATGLEALMTRLRPDAVAVESLFHHKNARSALVLGHARGVVLLSVARAGAPVFEYSPAVIKRATTGSGRADKATVERMLRFLLTGFSGTIAADASDALAIALCHIQSAPTQARLQRLAAGTRS